MSRLRLRLRCKTNNGLQNLRTAFENRKMNNIAESDFRKLLSSGDRPFTTMLEVSLEDAGRCDTFTRCRPFSDTCIDDMPTEVLDIILTKAYALHFYRFKPRPREKELFETFSSVSGFWLDTISRRRFKASLNRRLRAYFLSVRKRQTIIRSNKQYLVENMEPSATLIRRLEKVGCLTKKEANYVKHLRGNNAKNHELLNAASKMSFKKHFSFVESLHLCDQLKVANVLEKGGVVFKLTGTSAGVSTNSKFMKNLNGSIPNENQTYGRLTSYMPPSDVTISKELELLKVQTSEGKNGKQYIAIWLWCDSKRSADQLCELAQSDKLLKCLDNLMTYTLPNGTETQHDLISFVRDASSLQFMKTLTFDMKLFQRTVAVRLLSTKFSGEFNLPTDTRALTSLDDNIYVLTDHAILIYQDVSPYDRHTEVVFPSAEPQTVNPDDTAKHQWLISACHQTKCIYVARHNDQRIWKLKTPEYSLEVWMNCIETLCSLSVTSDGSVLLLKPYRQTSLPGTPTHDLDIYTTEAVPKYDRSINLDTPSRRYPYTSKSRLVLEISPGNFAMNCFDVLLVKSVKFDTLTTADQNLILYPDDNWRSGVISGIALYSANRLIAAFANRLAIFDSRLNVGSQLDLRILSRSYTSRKLIELHYRMDKRQAIVWQPTSSFVHIFTLQYEGEDLFSDHV